MRLFIQGDDKKSEMKPELQAIICKINGTCCRGAGTDEKAESLDDT